MTGCAHEPAGRTAPPHVIRMAGLYLVGGWLIVQVAETLPPIFGTPDGVLNS